MRQRYAFIDIVQNDIWKEGKSRHKVIYSPNFKVAFSLGAVYLKVALNSIVWKQGNIIEQTFTFANYKVIYICIYSVMLIHNTELNKWQANLKEAIQYFKNSSWPTSYLNSIKWCSFNHKNSIMFVFRSEAFDMH